MSESRTVSSNQHNIHPRLHSTVSRHLQHPFLRPYAAHSLRTFETINTVVQAHSGPLILDSYCGVGESTAALATQYPEALVLGLDKSAHRLEKHEQHYRRTGIDNYQLVRADVDDIWRLAVSAGWRLNAHYLLYPNPWPKAAQLQRRCHGSPLFPSLLALGGTLELRSNWALYVEEFAQALTLAGYPAQAETYLPTVPITPFERKYQSANQSLWRCRCSLEKT